MSALPNEYTKVELPLLRQLLAMGWSHVEGSKWEPAASDRESFGEVVLSRRLRDALRRINVDDVGNEWLDESRVAQAEATLLRSPALKLIEANQEVTALLLTGTTVDGVEGRDGGRGQTVHYIDWEHPERNEFLAINQFRVDEPGGQAHKFVVPDVVLFVNGIPLVVIECKNPYITAPAVEAIDQLQRYANQRSRVHDAEGNERLFHSNQFVVATYFDKAMVGTFTSEGEHFAEWKETEPVSRDQVATELGKAPADLSSQEILVAGMLRPAHLLDIFRNFTLHMPIEGRTVKIIGRYQQHRAVQRSIERLTTGKTRAEDGEFDRRGGIVWHTQGSGKSLTMVFLIRKMRTLPELRRFKVVAVTDRTDLQRQLSNTAALTGETVDVGKSVAKVKELLARPGPGLVFAMIQKYREVDADLAGEATDTKGKSEDKEQFGLLNESDAIVVLVDEAHRSHSSNLHANLLSALPNCARIGFTGTPIIMGERKRTHEIFGEFIDTYTIRESEADGATVPILYEGRTTRGAVTDGRDLDEVFEDMFSERTTEELDAIKKRWATKGNVLEAPKMIDAKARDILRHYVDGVMPNGFKAQVVATSRLAAVRYRDGFLRARDELVAEIERLDPALTTPDGIDRAADLPTKTARLVRASAHLSLIRALDFVPVISGSHNDDPDWLQWSTGDKHKTNIAAFKLALGQVSETKPGQVSPVAFLIVKSMLLTGFDAPVEQVLYLDRSIKEAELLQAIARVNRTASGKNVGYVVDYYGVGEHLKQALAAYSSDDLEGLLQTIEDELPKLTDRRQRVRNLFLERGLDRFDTENDLEACVTALEDERLRAAFEVSLKQFLTTLDIVMPRPESLPFNRDAKFFGMVQVRARRRYREGDTFDVSLYGEKVRALIDDHVLALGVDQKIPPVSITAPDFRSKVSGLGNDRAKASEMEHAIRYHIRKHFDEDPAHYSKLSEKLDRILEALKEQWDQLALALSDLVDDALKGRQVDSTGLDPETEAPFYGLLGQELEAEATAERVLATPDAPVAELSAMEAEVLRQTTVGLVAHLRREIAVVGFWQNAYAQDMLRRWVVQHLDSQQVGGHDLFQLDRLSEVAAHVVELARANHSKLVGRA
ncbi:MAG TPA: type I restriction endonuclease subunit R [Dermatophilaceae bacterium]